MRERHLVQDPRAQLVALRAREHALAGLDAREHAVAVQDAGREAVVVQDLGLLALGQLHRGERAANAGSQVLGGLVGEGQAQDVAGKDARVVRLGMRPSATSAR